MLGYEGYHSEVLIPYDVLHPGDLKGSSDTCMYRCTCVSNSRVMKRYEDM